jgi:hypothetical protein
MVYPLFALSPVGLTRGSITQKFSLVRWIAGSFHSKTRFALLPGNDEFEA